MNIDIPMILRTYLANMNVTNCSLFESFLIIKLHDHYNSFEVCFECKWQYANENGTLINSEQIQMDTEEKLKASLINGEPLRYIMIDPITNDITLKFNGFYLKTEADNTLDIQSWYIIDKRLMRSFSPHPSGIILTQL